MAEGVKDMKWPWSVRNEWKERALSAETRVRILEKENAAMRQEQSISREALAVANQQVSRLADQVRQMSMRG
jgi:hypothetical protein